MGAGHFAVSASPLLAPERFRGLQMKRCPELSSGIVSHDKDVPCFNLIGLALFEVDKGYFHMTRAVSTAIAVFV